MFATKMPSSAQLGHVDGMLAQAGPIADEIYDYDLGAHHRAVNTASAVAQRWFDRGLIWTYAFNHEEAARCFERAVAADAACAMAHWGLAYALGPNYNKPWSFFDEDDFQSSVRRTRAAALQAQRLAEAALARDKASPAAAIEMALASAMVARYVDAAEPELGSAGRRSERERAVDRTRAYADAMASVYARFPDDVDVVALYADALMNLTPWALWDVRTGEPAPGSRALDVKAALDKVLLGSGGGSGCVSPCGGGGGGGDGGGGVDSTRGGRLSGGGLRHPGVLHMYIHLMEMSSAPEAALRVADELRGLVPDAGHLQHMPTHLDVLCGDYRRAIASNGAAVRADDKYLARAGTMNFYTLYRAHNHHFRLYAAMFAGQARPALESATELAQSIPEQLLRVESPPMADWLESFVAMRVHVLVRFGRWQEILALELPVDTALYCVTTAMTHYAKGIAFAASRDVGSAETQQRSFDAAASRVPASRTLFNNRSTDILQVAGAMLAGEIEYRRGNIETAFTQLRRAVALDDALPYDEPWGWMQPPRHAYGALLLEQGRVDEAAAVYRADLGMDTTLPRVQQHPNNVWALHGFHECLVRLGRAAEARMLEMQLKLAVAVADVPIESSCFCRLETVRFTAAH